MPPIHLPNEGFREDCYRCDQSLKHNLWSCKCVCLHMRFCLNTVLKNVLFSNPPKSQTGRTRRSNADDKVWRVGCGSWVTAEFIGNKKSMKLTLKIKTSRAQNIRSLFLTIGSSLALCLLEVICLCVTHRLVVPHISVHCLHLTTNTLRRQTGSPDCFHAAPAQV